MPTYISVRPGPTRTLPNNSKVWRLAQCESDKLRTEPLSRTSQISGVVRRRAAYLSEENRDHANEASSPPINGGSSSIKFALFDVTTRVLEGKIDRIGSEAATFSFTATLRAGRRKPARSCGGRIRSRGFTHRLDYHPNWFRLNRCDRTSRRAWRRQVECAATIDDNLLAELRRITPYDPDHLPAEIRLIERFRGRFRNVPHVACFDTAFHKDVPAVAKTIAIPRRFRQRTGVRRYGFHGLSYAYLIQELERIAGAEAANSRVILAHLGNGASLAAVQGGRSVDTTMAFTPAAGLMMSTRSGDIDPGASFISSAKRRGDRCAIRPHGESRVRTARGCRKKFRHAGFTRA